VKLARAGAAASSRRPGSVCVAVGPLPTPGWCSPCSRTPLWLVPQNQWPGRESSPFEASSCEKSEGAHPSSPCGSCLPGEPHGPLQAGGWFQGRSGAHRGLPCCDQSHLWLLRWSFAYCSCWCALPALLTHGLCSAGSMSSGQCQPGPTKLRRAGSERSRGPSPPPGCRALRLELWNVLWQHWLRLTAACWQGWSLMAAWRSASHTLSPCTEKGSGLLETIHPFMAAATGEAGWWLLFCWLWWALPALPLICPVYCSQAALLAAPHELLLHHSWSAGSAGLHPGGCGTLCLRREVLFLSPWPVSACCSYPDPPACFWASHTGCGAAEL
jgi:hypothetical protein